MKSPLSFRDNVPGAVASGQVCRIARPTNSASSASPTTTVDEREPSLASALVDVWRGFTGCAGWLMFVDREIGTGPDDVFEARQRDVEGVLLVVDEVGGW